MILYTTTAYPPSIGGAQLHLHEYARRVNSTFPVGVLYQWDTNRTDWLRGTTTNSPYPGRGANTLDNVPTFQMTLSLDEREKLHQWVRFYRLTQTESLKRISAAFLRTIEASVPLLCDYKPRLIQNTRIGREGLTAASLAYARKHDIPFILVPNHHPQWKTWFHRHYLKMYQQADHLIVQTAYERDELARLGVNSSRITILGVGSILAPSAHPDAFRQAYGIAIDAPIILFLGQKYKYKRFRMLVEAMPIIWKLYPHAVLVLIGPRTLDSRSYFAHHHHPNIIELDAVDLQTKTDALAACTLLCVPSVRESFGSVYLEAWMFNKPVIGGNAPAIREVIEDGLNGFIIDQSTSQLAKRIIACIADDALAAALGHSGYRKALTYTWEQLTERLLGVYRMLLGD